LIKYIKSILWRVAKRLSYTEDARCLKVNMDWDVTVVKFCEQGGETLGWRLKYSAGWRH